MSAAGMRDWVPWASEKVQGRWPALGLREWAKLTSAGEE